MTAKVEPIGRLWQQVFSMLIPYAEQCGPNECVCISWAFYEAVLGRTKDTTLSAWKRADKELQACYGIGVVSQDPGGFVLGRIG